VCRGCGGARGRRICGQHEQRHRNEHRRHRSGDDLEHGPNLIIDDDATRALVGILTGTVVERLQDTVHPNGVITVKGAGTFTGTLGGCGSTTYVIPFSVEGQVTPAGDLTARFQSVGNNAGWFHGQATGRPNDVPALPLQVSAVTRC
jgi:hypothetical protein